MHGAEQLSAVPTIKLLAEKWNFGIGQGKYYDMIFFL